MKNKIELFLEDMSYHSNFRILEWGTDNDEMKMVAQKRGILLPAHDLAIFKCVYAYVDRMNKNGCTLPKDEVEGALGTLIGKAVDFDHFRERIVGYWVEAIIDGDKIIAYGIFFKGNLVEDYNDVKNLMNKGKLGVSFEAWGCKDLE